MLHCRYLRLRRALPIAVIVACVGTCDIGGDIVSDGLFRYQYDGWNRLVQVNEAGTLTDADFDADTGFLIPPNPNDPNDPDGVPGDPVARFVYDGLGRLMFYSTHLDYSTPIDEHVNHHLYYDGVRRVSEQRHTRLWGYPIVDRWDQFDYVWGPDYVDELALVIHREGGVRYAIQDANNNLVAWMKAGSVVAAQYTYGPYGELRAADLRPTETEWPSMGVGHQGLFFVRFDGDPDDPPHAVGARGLYYNRNRWYSPDLGRFIQRDVNETALPIIVALAFNGETLNALLGAFDGQGLYGDGMNLYAYLGANPVNGLDALGLDEYDDVFDDLSGHRLYALGTINEYANRASLGLEIALEIASALLGIDVFQSVMVIADGGGGLTPAKISRRGYAFRIDPPHVRFSIERHPAGFVNEQHWAFHLDTDEFCCESEKTLRSDLGTDENGRVCCPDCGSVELVITPGEVRCQECPFGRLHEHSLQ